MKRRASTDSAAMQPPSAPDASNAAHADRGSVRGERGRPVIARALSAQARASNYLALGLMLAIGVGLLLWYYAQQLSRQGGARHSAHPSPVRLVAAEMALPPLGPIEGPQLASAPVSAPPSSSALSPSPPAPPPLLSSPSPLLPMLAVARIPASAAQRRAPTGYPSSAAPPTHQSALQRRLSGGVLFAAPADPGASVEQVVPATADTGVRSAQLPPATDSAGAVPGADAQGGLSALLQHPITQIAAARLLPDRSLLLPKGAFIDCTLETAIDSTLPGMTTCVTATDTFSADGRVVLLERGTKLVGETRGQVQQGAARIFVLWTEARTPGGVVVPLDSPGADELGRSGLPGQVQRHFWERFGAAILVSTIDGGVQAAVQSSNRGNGTVIYDPGAAQDVMTDVLKSTVAIPPTVIKRNGDRIQVLVARDVDFSGVYELRDVVRGQ